MKHYLLILVLLFSCHCFSQSIFTGKLLSNSPNEINIINISNYQTSISNNEGVFKITAKPSDTLLITSDKINGLQIIVKDYHFKEAIVNIKTTQKIHELEEVIIKRDNTITALSLGIISEKMVPYSPAERRLKTKTKIDSRIGFNDQFNNNLLSKSVSSKNSDLINNLIIERKEALLEKISANFETDYFTNKLKIAETHVKGFQYFVVEDINFVKAFNAKNKIATQFCLQDLAIKYNKILKNE